MKEAFEKIRKRIDEITISRNIYGSICGCNMGKCEDDDCLKCLKKKIFSIVSEVEAEYGNGWIPCSERLPHEGQKVLACVNPSIAKHEIILAPYEGHCNSWHDGSIIAWMPLPLPYKEEGGEE